MSTGFQQNIEMLWEAANNTVLQLMFGTRNPGEASFPKYVSHYTSFSGLSGIITSRSIWLTPLSHMNDYSEYQMGHHLIYRKVLPSLLEGTDRKHYNYKQSIIDKLIFDNGNNQIDEYLNTYISCWSQCEIDEAVNSLDKLSMWRGYAADGNGAAMVFNLEATGINPTEGSEVRLLKVRYESEDDLKKHVIYSINSFFEDISQSGGENSFAESNVIECVKFICDTLALTHKVPAFNEEREWRLVLTPDLLDSILSRPTNVVKGILQHDARSVIELSLDGRSELIPKPVFLRDILSHVMIGPCSWDLKHSRKMAISQFLRENDLSNTRILESKIPYRSRR